VGLADLEARNQLPGGAMHKFGQTLCAGCTALPATELVLNDGELLNVLMFSDFSLSALPLA
jgi:hypothetical protein